MTNATLSTRPSSVRATRRAQAISIGVADVHRAPDASSELVTQALMGAAAVPIASTNDGWAHVHLVDYDGWVRAEHLARPARQSRELAVVLAPATPVYTSSFGSDIACEVFATSLLPITAPVAVPPFARLRVALPGARTGWIAADAIEQRPANAPYPTRGPEAAIALARRLLDVPYLWGGVTQRGIDCSGLAQLACRAAGASIPRDADQQYADMPYIVDRESVRLGDLVFFAENGTVTHVGIALDNMTLLHANGHTHSVSITSLDPAAGDYPARLAGLYAGARRAFTDQSASR